MLLALTVALLASRGEVRIYRDLFGVPSIVASNYTDACYGLGYATIEDHGEQMALNYKQARGRMGEVRGKSQLLTDGFLRSLGIEELARAKARARGPYRPYFEAFLAGANRALQERKAKLPAWIEPFDLVDTFALAQLVNAAFPLQEVAGKLMPGSGSNQFAVAPVRSATGAPILSMDPHLPWNGPITWYEYAIYTPDVSFRGITVPGLPAPVMGHNRKVAWCMTNNDPDLYDFFIVKPNPENPRQYSYHGQWREFEDSEVELRYLEDGELKTQKQRVRRTAWGPMVPLRPQALFLSMLGSWELLATSDGLLRAGSVEEARRAIALLGLSMWNIVVADTSGDILYQYNARVPRRDPSFDWSKPIDGADPRTRLGELIPADQLPHAANPRSGLLVNCNSAPWLTTLGDEISREWPAYVTTYGHTTRYDILSSLLAADRKISIDEAKAYAVDTKVPYAKEAIAALGATGHSSPAMDVLRQWNGRADISARGCAMYAYWAREKEMPALIRQVASGKPWTPEQGGVAVRALAAAAEKLKRDHGALSVEWGDVHRMSRGGWSVPILGWGYVVGGDAAVAPNSGPFKDGIFQCDFGSSWRMIVSLEPAGIRSWSALPYGNSSDPASPHYADQMALFGRGQTKEVPFGAEAARRAAKRTVVLEPPGKTE